MRKITCAAACLTAAFVSAGCATQPIMQDQPPALGPEEGIAAVAIDSDWPLSQVFIDPAGPYGDEMEIKQIPEEKTLYLFKVKAGDYCFAQFHVGRQMYNEKWNKHKFCFRVPAGQIGYGGMYKPYVVYMGARTYWIFDPTFFKGMLRRNYPRIAAKFLPSFNPLASLINPPVQPATFATRSQCEKREDVCSWTEAAANRASDLVVVENDSYKTMTINAITLSDCVNVRQDCVTLPVHITVDPGKTEPVFVVTPTRPERYNYQYQLHYTLGQAAKGKASAGPR